MSVEYRGTGTSASGIPPEALQRVLLDQRVQARRHLLGGVVVLLPGRHRQACALAKIESRQVDQQLQHRRVRQVGASVEAQLRRLNKDMETPR